MVKGFVAFVHPTVIPRQVVYGIEPFHPLVRTSVSLRNQGIGIVRGADENLDQVATKLLHMSLPSQRRSAFAAEAALDTRR